MKGEARSSSFKFCVHTCLNICVMVFLIHIGRKGSIPHLDRVKGALLAPTKESDVTNIFIYVRLMGVESHKLIS